MLVPTFQSLAEFWFDRFCSFPFDAVQCPFYINLSKLFSTTFPLPTASCKLRFTVTIFSLSFHLQWINSDYWLYFIKAFPLPKLKAIGSNLLSSTFKWFSLFLADFNRVLFNAWPLLPIRQLLLFDKEKLPFQSYG